MKDPQVGAEEGEDMVDTTVDQIAGTGDFSDDSGHEH
jgi:hypothetical protein